MRTAFPMPGFAGIIGATDGEGAAAFDRMASALRGPSGPEAGRLDDRSLGIRIAWAGRAGPDPRCLWNARKDLAVIFCGDDLALRGLASELRAQGRRFDDDLESVLLRYEERSCGVLPELNGAFSGLILDFRRRLAVLFNDRFGVGRVYLHETPNGLLFSSGIKPLLAACPALRRFDPRGLAEYLAVGCVLQNRTLFPQVKLLPPASQWIVQADGRREEIRYFDPRAWEEQPVLSAANYEERLTEVFARIVPRCLNGRDPIGLSLTGGLDSRMVLAWTHAAPGRLPCYTFGGPYRDCADVAIARDLAGRCGQPHTTLRIGADFFRDFAALAERTVAESDATMDVSGAVELYVNRQARGIAPVRLTGNYGSEILRRYVAFRPARLDRSLYTPEFTALLDAAADTYREEAAGHRLSFIAFKQVPWHHFARRAVERSQLAPRSPFLDNELVALAFQAPAEALATVEPLLALIAQGDSRLAAVRTDRAHRRRPLPLIGTAAKRWQEFTAKAEYAYDYGMPQWLNRIDRAVAPLRLERLFLGHHKFYHFRVWYRDHLADFLRTAAESGPEPFCYRPGAARTVIHDHVEGRGNRTLDVHRLLTLQFAQKLFCS